MIRTLSIILSDALELQNCPIASVQLDVSQLGAFRVAAQDFLSKTGCTEIRAKACALKITPLFLDDEGNQLGVDSSAYDIDLAYFPSGLISVFWNSRDPDAVTEWFFTVVSNMDFYQDTGRFLP